jgi:hypothetical protein
VVIQRNQELWRYPVFNVEVTYSSLIFLLGAEFTQSYATTYGCRLIPSAHAKKSSEASNLTFVLPRAFSHRADIQLRETGAKELAGANEMLSLMT